MIYRGVVKNLDELRDFSRDLNSKYLKDETRVHGIVYAISFVGGVVKVGKTQDPLNRFCNVVNASGRHIEGIFACLTDNYSQVETKSINSLSSYNVFSEYFECDFDTAILTISSYEVHIDNDEIAERNAIYEVKCKEASHHLVRAISSIKSDVNIDDIIELSNHQIGNRMFYGYGTFDYGDILSILKLEITFEELNSILIKNGLFDSVGVVSDYSMDERLMRNITSEWVDFDFTTWKCSSTLVTKKGLDYIRKLLKKELVK